MKKLFLLLLAGLLCLSVVACKGSENGGSPDSLKVETKPLEPTFPTGNEGSVNDGRYLILGGRKYYAYQNGKFSKDFPLDKKVVDGKVLLDIDYIVEGDVYIVGYTEYSYDGDFLKETVSYDTMCRQVYRKTFEPDEHGNNAKTYNYDENNELFQIVERDFVKVKDSKSDSGFSYRESQRREFDKDGNPTGKCDIEYYTTGIATPIKKTYYDGEGNLTFIYEYDENEKYTKMYTYKDGKLTEVKDF